MRERGNRWRATKIALDSWDSRSARNSLGRVANNSPKAIFCQRENPPKLFRNAGSARERGEYAVGRGSARALAFLPSGMSGLVRTALALPWMLWKWFERFGTRVARPSEIWLRPRCAGKFPSDPQSASLAVPEGRGVSPRVLVADRAVPQRLDVTVQMRDVDPIVVAWQ